MISRVHVVVLKRFTVQNCVNSSNLNDVGSTGVVSVTEISVKITAFWDMTPCSLLPSTVVKR
jgi:hypothetical protein